MDLSININDTVQLILFKFQQINKSRRLLNTLLERYDVTEFFTTWVVYGHGDCSYACR